jgi:uncharacterized protein YjbI with pentapeptide repeats
MVNSKGTNQEATMESTGTARLRKWVLVGLGVGTLVSLLLGLLLTCDWGGLLLNLGAEFGGALATYGLLELLIRRREEEEEKEEELEAKKADLIAQMGSSVKDVAIAAAEELGRYGWLRDGSLRGADLLHANLQGASLSKANLQGAYLYGANLQGSDLTVANLSGADLRHANLQGSLLSDALLSGADLSRADLSEANLSGAELRGTDMTFANLRKGYLLLADLSEANLYLTDLGEATLSRADLSGADLIGTKLKGAELSEDTTLPDGTKWTPATDMARFTYPDHPDFWRPDA